MGGDAAHALLTAAAHAGRAHGQTAGEQAGCVHLEGRKRVENGARALVLIAPGLFRLDVRPQRDSLQIFTRTLHPGPAHWEALEASGDEAGHRAAWRATFGEIRAHVGLHSTPQPGEQAWELRAEADLWPVMLPAAN